MRRLTAQDDPKTFSTAVFTRHGPTVLNRLRDFDSEHDQFREASSIFTGKDARDKLDREIRSLDDDEFGHAAFISYRREGGAETARLIRAELAKRGFHCFLDVDDLGSHYFDESLLKEIGNAPNFILILTPNCLDRCVEETDWLRREIAHAIRTQRNVIPIIKDGFDFPSSDVLPSELATLPRHNGVPYSHNYFDAAIDQLVRLMGSGSATK